MYPSFMTKFCSALYLENLLTNIFAKLNLCGGVSCMPAALLFFTVLPHYNMSTEIMNQMVFTFLILCICCSHQLSG